uniref:ATP-dependent DNA helicase n=1 Tax=Panagrolaimus sp. ES5 TaxID=591445 RepID=A0AC34GJ26_9BILA
MRVDADELDFVKFLDELGNPYLDPNTPKVDLHKVLLDESQMLQTPEELIDFCFPPHVLDNPLAHSKELLESAILCPTNQNTFTMNDEILELIPGEPQTFISLDKQ